MGSLAFILQQILTRQWEQVTNNLETFAKVGLHEASSGVLTMIIKDVICLNSMADTMALHVLHGDIDGASSHLFL